jgi:HEPN domain-containing protein
MTTEHSDYLKYWLFPAGEDILVIEKLFNSELKLFASSICFHAQQAIEKFLKSFLVYHNGNFTKTHDLDFQPIECTKINYNYY